MERPMLEDGPLETSAQERIVQIVTKVAHKVTGRNQLVGVPYGSDASTRQTDPDEKLSSSRQVIGGRYRPKYERLRW